MTVKQDIRRISKEIQAAFDTPEGEKALHDLIEALPTALISLSLLRKARKAHKQGDNLKGIFYLILWHGIANNAGLDRLHKAVDRANAANIAVNLPPAPRIGHTNTGGLFN